MSPADALAQYLHTQPGISQVCIAFSAGMDSHVLLHLAAQQLRSRDDLDLRAIHIDHGLQDESEQWVKHAQQVCDGLGVPLIVRKVVVDDKPDGPEGGARMARYEAFADILKPGEHLLLAQHADDQAETFLLQALRGSGPDGLASIPHKRTFAGAYMGRPLLGCTQQSLADYAWANGLSWIDDPSNADSRFDRNFIRNEVLPLIRTRWPAATKTLSRSAMRSAASVQTLHDVAVDDLNVVHVQGTSELSIVSLRVLPAERCFNVLRLWVRQAGLRMPRLQDLQQVMSNLLYARADSLGVVKVRDYEFRRHGDKLFLIDRPVKNEPFSHEWEAPYDDLLINETGQLLSRGGCEQQGLQLPPGGSITVRSRIGGELIKLGEPAFHKAVKKVLQEAAVPPWQRDAIPLLYVNGRLAAVWDVVVAVDFRATAELA